MESRNLLSKQLLNSIKVPLSRFYSTKYDSNFPNENDYETFDASATTEVSINMKYGSGYVHQLLLPDVFSFTLTH